MSLTSVKRVKIAADKMLDIRRYLPKISGVEFDIFEYNGREISADHLIHSDALLIRSITNVDEKLLGDSRVEFVGSATIGCDHIDLRWLQNNGISFSYAPGCNANAVVDYVMATLFDFFGVNLLQRKQVGIVGFGNVGKRLTACLKYFGLPVKVYDPLVDVPEDLSVNNFNEILMCDAVSLHVPLTHEGKHATYHRLADIELKLFKEDRLLINTSRGAVINNCLLNKLLSEGKGFSVALDVWENEPEIDTELLGRVNYSTGHIAGYSRLGKERGVHVIVDALLKHLHTTKKIFLPAQDQPKLSEQPRQLVSIDSLEQYADQLLTVMNIVQESDFFRGQLNIDKHSEGMGGPIAERFDHYRKTYTLRDEFDYSCLLERSSR